MRMDRRHFLVNSGVGLGALALGTMTAPAGAATPRLRRPPAKRVIYLFQAGAPSQIDLFEDKPKVRKHAGEDLRKHVRMKRVTGMTSGQSTYPISPGYFKYRRHGESGFAFSSLLPETAKIADRLTFVRSLYSDHVNHDPALTFFQTGHQFPGRPSFGSWLSYGLGTLNRNLPDFMVLVSKGDMDAAQPLLARHWGAGFLPGRHAGVKLRAGREAVLFLDEPSGQTVEDEAASLEAIRALNARHHARTGNPEVLTRMAQYEMSARMQASVPDLLDFADEPESTWKLYGKEASKPGTYAYNCLLARRMAERDVRFVQLYHMGWDHHSSLKRDIAKQCRETDRGSAALVVDLQRRGLLDDTIVIWGSEFGRTVYSQGLKRESAGRDHHPYCFTYWLAGGGLKPGTSFGETDDFGYHITEDKTDVHDLHATLLHQLGIDHERLTFRYQGRDYRLTDVHGKVIRPILA
ncbi:MAG: sulfatase [Planctomycetes bacterium]|nr:sulfatase [Planctomycetota bacterium]